MPPELMGVALNATRRTPNHDNFGLAVLIFHLLFIGRHPFAGRYLGKGEMPIEKAITECRFAYSTDRGRTQTEPPPLTPPMAVVGVEVMALFETAFHPSSRKGLRSTPQEWIDALEALKATLMPCVSIPWHFHPPAASPCPWCEIEQHARIKLFGGLMRAVPSGIADLETLWAKYLALVDPAPPRPLPVAPPRPRRTVVRWLVQTSARGGLRVLNGLEGLGRLGPKIRAATARINWIAVYIVIFAVFMAIDFNRGAILTAAKNLPVRVEGVVTYVARGPGDAIWTGLGIITLILVVSPLSVFLTPLLRGVARVFIAPPKAALAAVARIPSAAPRIGRREARRAWKAASEAWLALPPPPDVSHLRPPIEALKRELDALVRKREVAIKALAVAEPVDVQRARYLGRLRIEDAKLAGVGPARCVVLRSWGIDTAADIDETKIAAIPGFGKGLTDKLVVWKEAKEKSFRPDHAAVVDPIEVQKIDRRLAARRASLVKDLREKIVGIEAHMKDPLCLKSGRWSSVEQAYQALLHRD